MYTGSHNYGDVAFYAKRVLRGNELINVGDFQFYEESTPRLVNYIGNDVDIVLPPNYNGKSYSIGTYAFYDHDIYSLTISSNVISIGEKAFERPKKVIWLANTPPNGYMNAIGSINYVANNQFIDLEYNATVKVYPYLSSIFMVDGVKYVPLNPSDRTCHVIDCAYDSTAAVINIGQTVSFKGLNMEIAEVMPYAFYKNAHIKDVTISHKGDLGTYAFFDCDNIQSLNVSNLGDIGKQCFYDCSGITTAKIYNQGNIYSMAFCGCDKMEHVDISNQGSIGEECFSSCHKLSKVILHEGITQLSDKAFAACGNLSQIEIPGSVSKIERRVFYACDSLVSISVAESNKTYDSRDNCNAIIEKNGDVLIIGCNATIIPATVVEIGEYAFSGCNKLSKITLSENIKSLHNSAFAECKNLIEVDLPNSVKSIGYKCYAECTSLNSIKLGGATSIGDDAFSGCTSLNSVELGETTSIGEYAFADCVSLTEIILPENLETVGYAVFDDCRNLKNVIIEDRTEALTLETDFAGPLFADCPLDSVYIGGDITYNTSSYGRSPFYGNASLRTVVIAGKAEEISDNEFYGCTNLKNVTIGSDVKKIGNWAFSGCSNLDYFSFGKSVESIGQEAFSDCVNLTKLISYAEVPPTCGTMALDDINKWNCVLQVPQSCLAAYQQADQWKEFFFIEDVLTAIGGVTADGAVSATADVYSTNGMLIKRNAELKNWHNELPAGIYIIGGKKVWVK